MIDSEKLRQEIATSHHRRMNSVRAHAIITAMRDAMKEYRQHTGRKDCNGKEIMEGHQVLVPDFFNEPISVSGEATMDLQGEIVFKDACFFIKGLNHHPLYTIPENNIVIQTQKIEPDDH